MDAWAKRYGDSAAFICVSCAGPQLATQFGNQQRLQHCHNTWVDQDDMPTWGQLGCNGFIILDSSHSVVCKASRAYLEVREQAFRHVETLLSALIVEKPVPKQEDGSVDPSVGGACAKVRFGSKDAEEEKEEQQVSKVAKVSKVASVKVAALDDEHEQCEAVLAKLAQQRNAAALQELLSVYEEHFAHEEALLDEHLYAAAKEATGFSADKGARTSHFGDHEALLNSVRKMIDDRADVSATLASVSAAEVQKLASEFEKHATNYDGAYADRLSAAMAAAA
tara:strand:- start:1356 stop:2195 length:840 start_codon:yes stop_codon:yes gene_type:complete